MTSRLGTNYGSPALIANSLSPTPLPASSHGGSSSSPSTRGPSATCVSRRSAPQSQCDLPEHGFHLLPSSSLSPFHCLIFSCSTYTFTLSRLVAFVPCAITTSVSYVCQFVFTLTVECKSLKSIKGIYTVMTMVSPTVPTSSWDCVYISTCPVSGPSPPPGSYKGGGPGSTPTGLGFHLTNHLDHILNLPQPLF